MKIQKKVLTLILTFVLFIVAAVFEFSASASVPEVDLLSSPNITKITGTTFNEASSSETTATLAKNGGSVKFNLNVTENTAGTYYVLVKSGIDTISGKLNLKVEKGGNVLYNLTQDFITRHTRIGNNSTRLRTESNLELSAGTYTFTLTNTGTEYDYPLSVVEIRGLVLPLTSKFAAYNIADAYDINVSQGHYNNQLPHWSVSDTNLPDIIGGEPFYRAYFRSKSSNSLTYKIDAKTTGFYSIGLLQHTNNKQGKFIVSANGTSVTMDLENGVAAGETYGAHYYADDTNTILLKKGVNDIVITSGGDVSDSVAESDVCGYLNGFTLKLKTAATELLGNSIATKILATDIKDGATSISLKENESVDFLINVPKSSEGKYAIYLNAKTSTGGAELNLKASLNEVEKINMSQTTIGTRIRFSGVTHKTDNSEKHKDNGIQTLGEGIYTFTLTNTGTIMYPLDSVEIRSVELPLGTELTAFDAMDASYVDVPNYHYSTLSYNKIEVPEFPKIVGDSTFYCVYLREPSWTGCTYTINAEQSGKYKVGFLQKSTLKHGKVSISANGYTQELDLNKAVADETYGSNYYTVPDDIIVLKKGLNEVTIKAVESSSSSYCYLNGFTLKYDGEEPVLPEITLKGPDNETKITKTFLSGGKDEFLIKPDESVKFVLNVTDSCAGDYAMLLRLNSGTGHAFDMVIESDDGTKYYNFTHTMHSPTCRVSDQIYEMTYAHGDKGVIELTKGRYTFTILNIGANPMDFNYMAIRSVIIPLGTELTAINVCDGSYVNVSNNHYDSQMQYFEISNPGFPVLAGGGKFGGVHFANGRYITYTINAAQAGNYTVGCMKSVASHTIGVSISANNTEVILNSNEGQTDTENYGDRYFYTNQTIYLKQGLNKVTMKGTSVGGMVSGFTLHYVDVN